MTQSTTTNLTQRELDQQLVEAIQQQGPAGVTAFNCLIHSHREQLLRRCRAYLHNHDDAEDAAQETILRAYRGIQSFKGDASFRTWLFAIADNQCHTLVAKRRKHVLSDHLSALIDLHEQIRREGDQLDSEMQREIQRAINTLPAASRDVVLLRFFKDMALEDIAATTGLSLSATKMRLYRALEQLGRYLTQHPSQDFAAA